MTAYKVSSKNKSTGKWWGYGNIKEGKFGPQLSFRKTPELIALFNETPDGGWINFALFEDKPKEASNEESKNIDEEESEVPF